MNFKNLRIYRFFEPPHTATFADYLLQKHFRPVGNLDMLSTGFVSPYGDDGDLTCVENGCILFVMRRQEKILPPSVIKEYLNDRVAEIQERENRQVRAKERKALREELINELLAQAFKKTEDVYAYIDIENNWLVVNTSSEKRAQEVISLLRRSMGSCKTIDIKLNINPSHIMSEWCAGVVGPPEKLILNVECCNLADDEETVNCKFVSPFSKEIREHIGAGKQICKLSLVWNDHFTFTIDESFVITKLKMCDAPEEEDEAAQSLDDMFHTMTLEITPLIKGMIAAFGGENETAYQLMALNT